MKTHWYRLCLRLLVWLSLEIFLNLVGVDDLADYSEFTFQNRFTEYTMTEWNI